MYEEKLNGRFARLQAELGQVLYQRHATKRQLVKFDESIARIEARLAELNQVRRDVEAQEAIDKAQADTEGE